MITLKTNKPIAIDSPDHLNPAGCSNDNNSNLTYIQQIKNYFNKPILNVLDLGCAGGQIVADHISLGDVAVGLEGSSHALNGSGISNWKKYYNKNLFLCDITEPFECIDLDKKLIKFDVIQMWDVLEHIPEQKLPQLLTNIFNHLKDDGIFLGAISQQYDPIRHISVFSKEKWTIIFNNSNFTLDPCIVNVYPRIVCDGSPGMEGFSFSAKKLKTNE